jgi:hypothetical protein
MVYFCKVVNTAGNGVKRQSAFNHVTFSGPGHGRYSTGAANQVIHFFGTNQVLRFIHEAIMF